MQSKKNNQKELLSRYLDNRCSPEEWQEVLRLLATDVSARELLAALEESYKNVNWLGHEMNREQSSRIQGRLMQEIRDDTVVLKMPSKWGRMAVAAAMISVIIMGSVYLINTRSVGQVNKISKDVEKSPTSHEEIGPGGNKAVLTLSDGTAISLDDTKNGILPVQGNTSLQKGNGTLDYKPGVKAGSEILYNILSTPRGGQYQVTLPDGTRVWLNAVSSLRYPTSFTGNERRVEMTGEVYFEVAKNAEMPFIVDVNGAEVQVLGTHFNVMAYKDEEALQTTLLEGAVNFSYQKNVTVLQPGQQSLLTRNGQLKRVDAVEVNKIVAWKNGSFNFDGADIGTVLRQLSRWYDVEVDDQNPSTEIFYASIPRSMQLSEVLKALEMTGKIHFEIRQGKIIVK